MTHAAAETFAPESTFLHAMVSSPAQFLEPRSAPPPIANFFAGPHTTARLDPQATAHASFDRSHRIVHLSENWDHFVGATLRRSDLLSAGLLFRRLRTFVTDATTWECYRNLLERVAREHRGTAIEAPCGAIGRWSMRLTFSPGADETVRCQWSFARNQDPLPALWSQHRQPFSRTHDFLRMCGWCHHVHVDGAWRPIENVAESLRLLETVELPKITHGICPVCSAALRAESAAAFVDEPIAVSA